MARTTTLSNTWAVSHDDDDVWQLAAGSTEILHVSKLRDAAVGSAVLPISPLYGAHYVRFQVITSDNAGTIGVTDDIITGTKWNARGGRAWGVELIDGGWRCCSDACRSAEQRGALVRFPKAADILTLRIDCQTRSVSIALKSITLPPGHPHPSPPPAQSEYVTLPVALPEDVCSLRPWAVSAFAGDVFRLQSVEMSARAPWSPATHALFDADARALAVRMLVSGYLLAARRMAGGSEGAFTQLWLSHVLPAVMADTPDLNPGAD